MEFTIFAEFHSVIIQIKIASNGVIDSKWLPFEVNQIKSIFSNDYCLNDLPCMQGTDLKNLKTGGCCVIHEHVGVITKNGCGTSCTVYYERVSNKNKSSDLIIQKLINNS